MSLHENTFDYLKPTLVQQERMQACRTHAAAYAKALDDYLPDGPDKTWIMRELRTVAMWANVAITRHVDGAPRSEGQAQDYA